MRDVTSFCESFHGISDRPPSCQLRDMDAQSTAAGASVHLVEITFVHPPAAPISETVDIDVYFRPLNDRVQSSRLVATYQDETIVDQPLDVHVGVARVQIHCEAAGQVDFVVRAWDGTLGSKTATIALLPPEVVEELIKLFENSLADVVAAARDGMLGDEHISAAELESSPLLTMRVAWGLHFHRLMQDIGGLMSHIVSRRRKPELAGSPFELSTKLSHILVFLLDNRAYHVGNYILGQAMEVGETVTLNGVTVDKNDIDLEYLYQTMQGSGAQETPVQDRGSPGKME